MRLAEEPALSKRNPETTECLQLFQRVEPFANDRPEENHNPVGRVFYGASTMLCVPCSLALDGPALGAQAGEARLGELVRGAGFSRMRRATETPFNIVLEARP